MIDKLRNLNPNIEFYSVFDDTFSKFGRIIKTLNPDEIIETANKIPNPLNGSTYLP